MAFGGKRNVAAGLIGGRVGVAVRGLAIRMKRTQYLNYGSLMAVGAGFADTIWRFCAR